jgi:hypothetical protein
LFLSLREGQAQFGFRGKRKQSHLIVGLRAASAMVAASQAEGSIESLRSNTSDIHGHRRG